MPDTCFCARCLERFQQATGITLPAGSARERAALCSRRIGRRGCGGGSASSPTGCASSTPFATRCARPRCSARSTTRGPTTTSGARLEKLAIDLRAQAAYIDVFSPMPYHARFGHAGDPAWISRQVRWLGQHLGIAGTAGERHRIWPIVQIADWGEPVPLAQVQAVLTEGARRRPRA